MAEYFAQYYEDKTDLDQVPSLLDYVYDTVDDISDKPSVGINAVKIIISSLKKNTFYSFVPVFFLY